MYIADIIVISYFVIINIYWISLLILSLVALIPWYYFIFNLMEYTKIFIRAVITKINF